MTTNFRFLAVLVAIVLAGFDGAAHASCNPQVPQPPNPVPPNYDWTPLAQNWCSQLAACGYNTSTCVADYLSVIQMGGVNSGGSGAESTTTETATSQLACEQSEEYANHQTSCTTLTCGDMGHADMGASDMHSGDLATCYYRCPTGQCVVDPIDCPSCATGGLSCDMGSPQDLMSHSDLNPSHL